MHNFDKNANSSRTLEMVYNGITDPLRASFVGDEGILEVDMKGRTEGAFTNAIVLTQNVVRFGGMQLQYMLRVRVGDPINRFDIKIMKDDEHAIAEAGDRLEYAMDCYQRIVSGIVTPCTLEDVMKDFEYSRIKFEKNLYKRSIM